MGTVAMLGESAPRANSEWDVSWMETVRKAKHRAVFDAPMPRSVINLRNRSVSMGFADAIRKIYPLAEDQKVTDPETSCAFFPD